VRRQEGDRQKESSIESGSKTAAVNLRPAPLRMTASEERTYERARTLWLGFGAAVRSDANVSRTFGATVSSRQLLGSRTLMFFRSVLGSLL
jgi:hypothetical protein